MALCIIFHFLQVSIINAWILYKETYGLTKHEKYGNLLSFLDEIINEWSVMGVVADLEPVLASKVPRHTQKDWVSPSDIRYQGSQYYLTLIQKQEGIIGKSVSGMGALAEHLLCVKHVEYSYASLIQMEQIVLRNFMNTKTRCVNCFIGVYRWSYLGALLYTICSTQNACHFVIMYYSL